MPSPVAVVANQPIESKERVGIYIDGFNLYFGLRDRGWRRYYWLDVIALARGLLRDDQRLGDVKYFTARITGSADKMKR